MTTPPRLPTPAELERLQQLASKAHPLPWYANAADAEVAFVGSMSWMEIGLYEDDSADAFAFGPQGREISDQDEATFELLAEMRRQLDALLHAAAERTRLAGEVERLRGAIVLQVGNCSCGGTGVGERDDVPCGWCVGLRAALKETDSA